MARDDERMRVRERLGTLEGKPRGRRTVPGGRWDLDEIGASEFGNGDRVGRRARFGAGERGRSARHGLERGDDARSWAEGDGLEHDDSDRDRFERVGFEDDNADNDVAPGSGAPARFGRISASWDDGDDEFDRDDAEDDDAEDDDGAPGNGASARFGWRPAGWDEEVEHPRTPHWLSEPVGSVSLWHQRLVPERFRGIRLHPGRRGVLVLAGVGAAAVVVAFTAAQRERPVAQPVPPLPAALASQIPAVAAEPSAGAGPDTPAATAAAPADLVVSVVGLVEHVGLLHLPPGSRVADAVTIAVAKQGADLARLNLAQRLADGDQIIVGALGPNTGPPQLGSAVVAGSERPAGSARTSGSLSSGPAAKVDLNTATESDLDALPGVGPATAHAIVAWRTEHGRFTSIDQLTEIPGIGQSRLARLRNLVTT